jgi:hypothetical protein
MTLVIAFFAQPARGDETPLSPTESARLERSGRNKEIAGIVLTSIGIAAGVAAISTAIYFETSCSTSDCWSGLGAWFISLPVGVVGAGLLGAGIPLWVIGKRDVDRARRARLGVGAASLRLTW